MINRLLTINYLVLLFSLFFLSTGIAKPIVTMKFSPCPQTPNCVSTQSHSAAQRVTPLPYKGSIDAAKKRIKAVILSFPKTKLIHETQNSLHIEFRTTLFKFVDDVEVYIDNQEHVIHFKSSSRLGYWDFGVNRRRIEAIKQKFNLGLG